MFIFTAIFFFKTTCKNHAFLTRGSSDLTTLSSAVVYACLTIPNIEETFKKLNW